MGRVLRAAALAAALALAPPAALGQSPPPAPPEAAPAAPGPAAGTAPAGAGEPGFIDVSHEALEERLGDLVDWLDRIFGDRRYLEFGPPSSTVRWRSELRLTDEPRAYPHTTALVDLRLPAASAWLSRAHLVLTGEREPGGAPGDEGPVTELAASQGLLELRLDFLRQPRTLFYAGGGVRLAWPPQPFTRFRLRQDLPLGASLLARLVPSVFWEQGQGFGATAQVDLDQAISPTALVRASGAALVSEQSRGLEWGTSLELRGHVAERVMGALGASMNGAERSPVVVEQYRAFGRLRREMLRRWLFVEAEPEVVWPADPAGGYRTVFGIILRLEVLFVSEPPGPEPGGVTNAPSPPLPR